MIDRRKGERRSVPSEHLDVTRLEHENLCKEIDEVLRTLRRIEVELRAQTERIRSLEESTTMGRRQTG